MLVTGTGLASYFQIALDSCAVRIGDVNKHMFSFGCGSKNRYHNGTLVSGNMDQNLRNSSCLILSHNPFTLQASVDLDVRDLVPFNGQFSKPGPSTSVERALGFGAAPGVAGGGGGDWGQETDRGH